MLTTDSATKSAALVFGLACGARAAEAPAPFTVPIIYYKLPNRLKVALS